MQVPPDNELVIVCHCKPCQRPKGYKPTRDNMADQLLDLCENNPPQYSVIRTISTDAYYVDVNCPKMEGNTWLTVPRESIQVVWGKGCPVYPTLLSSPIDNGYSREVLQDIFTMARSRLKPNGKLVFPAYRSVSLEAVRSFTPPPGWTMEVTTTFPFIIKYSHEDQRPLNGFIVFSKTGGGRRKTRRKAPTGTLKQRLAAAKKRCFPGYDVYDYRVNRKGEFYDCAPAGMNRAKVRKTQRKKTA